MDGENKVIAFERNNLIFVFNFSISNSIFGYKFLAPKKGVYRIVLDSDRREFGGHNRIDDNIDYVTDETGLISLYLTNRTVLVLAKQ